MSKASLWVLKLWKQEWNPLLGYVIIGRIEDRGECKWLHLKFVDVVEKIGVGQGGHESRL